MFRERCYLKKYMLITPLAVYLLLTLGYPFIKAIDISFKNLFWGSTHTEWVGLRNYISLLNSKGFWLSMLFSLKFASVSTALEMLIGFIIAYFFFENFRGNRILLTFLVIPIMIAPVLFGLMSRLSLNSFVGSIPLYLQILGIKIDFLSPQNIIPTLILVDILQWTPFVFTIIYASLLTIPKDIMEASIIDGAGRFQILFRVIIPIISPSILSALFLRFIEAFRTFDSIYAISGGGPGDLTTTISIFIYKHGFTMGMQSYASAAGMLLLLFVLLPTIKLTKFFYVNY